MAFGITTQALVYPRENSQVEKFKIIFDDLFDRSYWAIYGDISNVFMENKTDYQMHPAVYHYTHFMLIVYMIIVSILLINLIISMFK